MFFFCDLEFIVIAFYMIILEKNKPRLIWLALALIIVREKCSSEI